MGQSVRPPATSPSSTLTPARCVARSRTPCNSTSNLKSILPAEIWVHEIMDRLTYDDLKKVESISTTFKDFIHQNRHLKDQLFRGQVDNQSLLSIHLDQSNESQSELELEDVHQPYHSATSTSIILNPALSTTSPSISYNIEMDKSGHLFTCLWIQAFGRDLEIGRNHFKVKNQFELEFHPIGLEAASQPAVAWFRFDFEKEGKIHKGTCERFGKNGNGRGSSSKGVTVLDVMSTWVKLMGGKKLAGWYRKPSGICFESKSVVSFRDGWKAKVIRNGNSIGMEISGSLSFDCSTKRNSGI